MSNINVPIYKTEAGVHNNPATVDSYSTTCLFGNILLKKTFSEVIIRYDNDLSQWVEDPVYVAGTSKVALRVFNECNSTFAYIHYGYHDFRIAQQCCNTGFAPTFQARFNISDADTVVTMEIAEGAGPAMASVDWADGSPKEVVSSAAPVSHQYVIPGNYLASFQVLVANVPNWAGFSITDGLANYFGFTEKGLADFAGQNFEEVVLNNLGLITWPVVPNTTKKINIETSQDTQVLNSTHAAPLLEEFRAMNATITTIAPSFVSSKPNLIFIDLRNTNLGADMPGYQNFIAELTNVVGNGGTLKTEGSGANPNAGGGGNILNGLIFGKGWTCTYD